MCITFYLYTVNRKIEYVCSCFVYYIVNYLSIIYSDDFLFVNLKISAEKGKQMIYIYMYILEQDSEHNHFGHLRCST